MQLQYSSLFISSQLRRIENYLFRDADPCHIEASPLICRANQWTDFYMIGIPVTKELILNSTLFQVSANLYFCEENVFKLQIF